METSLNYYSRNTRSKKIKLFSSPLKNQQQISKNKIKSGRISIRCSHFMTPVLIKTDRQPVYIEEQDSSQDQVPYFSSKESIIEEEQPNSSQQKQDRINFIQNEKVQEKKNEFGVESTKNAKEFIMEHIETDKEDQQNQKTLPRYYTFAEPFKLTAKKDQPLLLTMFSYETVTSVKQKSLQDKHISKRKSHSKPNFSEIRDQSICNAFLQNKFRKTSSLSHTPSKSKRCLKQFSTQQQLNSQSQTKNIFLLDLQQIFISEDNLKCSSLETPKYNNNLNLFQDKLLEQSESINTFKSQEETSTQQMKSEAQEYSRFQQDLFKREDIIDTKNQSNVLSLLHQIPEMEKKQSIYSTEAFTEKLYQSKVNSIIQNTQPFFDISSQEKIVPEERLETFYIKDLPSFTRSICKIQNIILRLPTKYQQYFTAISQKLMLEQIKAEEYAKKQDVIVDILSKIIAVEKVGLHVDEYLFSEEEEQQKILSNKLLIRLLVNKISK